MVNIYVRHILSGEITLDDVPQVWRSKVSARLDEVRGDQTE